MRSRRFSLCSGIFAKTPCWNFSSSLRHREKDGGPGPGQVCEKGVDSFAEEDAISEIDGRPFHSHALHDVGQRQIGEHARWH